MTAQQFLEQDPLRKYALMVPELSISTLGGLQIRIGAQTIAKLLSRKVELLLVYVALQQQPQSREVLCTLLWPDQPQARALSYLRTALANLQKQCAPYLHVTRQTIGMNPDSPYRVDVTILQTALDKALREPLDAATALRFEEALKLYQGPFLEGVYLRDAPDVERWISTQNASLRQRIVMGYHALGEFALAHQQSSRGITALQRSLELDPLHEHSHRLLMRLYRQAGQRGAALVQYEVCRKLLAEELQVDPSAETTALYQDIYAETGKVNLPPLTSVTVPIPTTLFVPRPHDLQAIDGLIQTPACRFITLIGLGGIGKTRLAIESATRYGSLYRDGVFYVSLTGFDTPDQITATMLHTLRLPLQGHLTPEKEIFQYFWQKQALLILDNVEASHENALFLAQLSAHANQLTVLVTARERLNLQEEWVYTVHGMAVPTLHDPQTAESEAVQLFLQSARRSRHEAIPAHDHAHIVRICQAVEGIPLAIELAASWVRLLSIEKIADEIDRSGDFLAAPTRNVPARHRSMRAVFDSSWTMLNAQERAAFCRLSVFRNGFTQAAAQQVAETTLFVLLALVDKSLLQVADGRYIFHEMLRQYAYEKLTESPDALTRVLDDHADYYAEFFDRTGSLLMQDPQDPTYVAVMSETQNCMLMWERLSQRGDVVTMGQLLRPFFRLFDMQNRYAEGARFFQQVVEQFQQSPTSVDALLLARAKILQALCSEVVNRYTESEALARESLPIFLAQDAVWDVQLAYRCLGRSAYAHGNYTDAQCYFELAKTLLEQMDEPSALATVFLRLSDIASVLGQHKHAKQSLQRALRLLDRPAFKVARIRFLTTLGDIHIKLGELSEAEGHLMEAQQLCQLSDNRLALTVVNSALGRVYAAQGRLAEAAQLFQQSVEDCERLKHTWGQVFALIHLGYILIRQDSSQSALVKLESALQMATAIRARWLMVMAERFISWAFLARGDEEQAAVHLHEALKGTHHLNAVPVTLEVLAGLAMLDAAQQHPRAAQLAAFVAAHPLCEYGTRMTVDPLLDPQVAVVSPNMPIEDLVQQLLDQME